MNQSLFLHSLSKIFEMAKIEEYLPGSKRISVAEYVFSGKIIKSLSEALLGIIMFIAAFGSLTSLARFDHL